jgi:hypothetical protein
MDKLFIEGFSGKNGRSEVYEVVSIDPSGIEKVEYEVHFNGQHEIAPSMGEASVRASELAGDSRFSDPAAQ